MTTVDQQPQEPGTPYDPAIAAYTLEGESMEAEYQRLMRSGYRHGVADTITIPEWQGVLEAVRTMAAPWGTYRRNKEEYFKNIIEQSIDTATKALAAWEARFGGKKEE